MKKRTTNGAKVLRHIQLPGMAMYDVMEAMTAFCFEPNEDATAPELMLPKKGKARYRLSSNGKLELFMERDKKKKSESHHIVDFENGSLVRTKLGVTILTLCYMPDVKDKSDLLMQQANAAAYALNCQEG